MDVWNIDGLQIRRYVWDVVDSNSYLIINGKSGLLIDAVDSDELYDELLGLEKLSVILTHAHFDHIIGLNKIRELCRGTQVYATKRCSSNIGNIYRNMSSTANAFISFYDSEKKTDIKPFVCEPAEIEFEDAYLFDWCGHEIKLLPFMGHSNDGLIACIDRKYIFSGDTLLAIPTVTRFPGGSKEKFWKEDIPRLKEMCAEMVFPGHGKPGGLEEMILINETVKV